MARFPYSAQPKFIFILTQSILHCQADVVHVFEYMYQQCLFCLNQNCPPPIFPFCNCGYLLPFPPDHLPLSKTMPQPWAVLCTNPTSPGETLVKISPFPYQMTRSAFHPVLHTLNLKKKTTKIQLIPSNDF